MPADIDKALPHYLENNAGISALVSDRIHPIKLPQGTTLPAVTFQDISNKVTSIHGQPSFMPSPIYQFVAYAVTVAEVVAIAKALKTALDGFRGNMGTGSYITEVEGVLFKDQRTTDEPDVNLFIRQQDYRIMYKE